MNKRYVKSIDKEVSEIGFGSWQLANNSTWGSMSEKEAIALVKEAYKKGVNMFDTAPGYGGGSSEKILGKALNDVREHVVFNTKVGHGPNGEYEFTEEGIRTSIQRSMKNLQTNYLDSVILHNPNKSIQEGNSPLIDELRNAKEKGLIRGWGFSIDSLEELKLVLENNEDVDTIEIMFNIIHQEPKYLFNEILNRGIFLIIKVPLDSGWLTGKYNKNSTFTGIRDRWTQDVKDIRSYIINEIKKIIGDAPMSKEALRFILSFHQVSTVIPGTKNIEQLDSNISATNYMMDFDTKIKLEELYEHQIKNLNTPW
jgi:aryl-alcohol dehydrogenase-like predicted oxidoreductase